MLRLTNLINFLMEKLFTCIFFFASLFYINAQDTTYRKLNYNILNDSLKISGIYCSMDDFRNNDPSIIDVKFNRKVHYDYGDSLFINFGKGVSIIDSSGNTVEVCKKIWGINDGVCTYIIIKKYFCEIHTFGKYNICIIEFEKKSGGTHTYPFTPVEVSMHEKEYVFDIDGGKVHKLNKRNLMKYILVDYPDLLKQFYKETDKDIFLHWYIKEINKRYE